MALPVQAEKSVATSTVSPSKASAIEPGKFPSLLTVRLLADIPVVKAVVQRSQSTWQTVKEGNVVAKWTLNAVEVAARSAAKSGRILGWFFKAPIGTADRTISGRIIEAERKWPILKESPSKVVEVTLETARSRLSSWYTASGMVAADGKLAVTAAADFTRRAVSTVQTSLHQSLTNFEDLVDEIAARSAGELRFVEGQSRASSEASGQPVVRRCGVVWRALLSGLYLCVGGGLWAASAAPGRVGRLARALRGLQADTQHSRQASNTSDRPASSSSASSRSQPDDE